MTEEQIKADRYAKFRKLGQFREYLVEGGDWKSADARREAAQGVTTETGRWAEVNCLHLAADDSKDPIASESWLATYYFAVK